MKTLDRINLKADSIRLHDNALWAFQITHNEKIEFILNSFGWNNDVEFSETEKLELTISEQTSVFLKETFYGVNIEDICYDSQFEVPNSTILTYRVISDNLFEADFSDTFGNYAYVRFSFGKFKWDILDVVDENHLDDYLNENLTDFLSK